MNEIMEKTYELIDVLENSELVQSIGIYRNRIMENKELRELIQVGNHTSDEYALLDIKRRLYQNKDYQSYIDKYNELMYLVMDINYRYGKLLGGRSCYR